MKICTAAAIPAILLLASCASEPPPGPIARAEQAIQTASAQGASQFAPLELRVAGERLAAARATGDDDRSRRLANEAVASAELATAKADAARAAAALEDLRRTAPAQTPVQ